MTVVCITYFFIVDKSPVAASGWFDMATHRERQPPACYSRHGCLTITRPKSNRTALHQLPAAISPFIKALRAVVHLAFANPSPGRAHDPSRGIWPCTELKSWTICKQLPVLSRTPRKETMMLRSLQEPDLFNSTSPWHVTQ